jgi:hypothetical protein
MTFPDLMPRQSAPVLRTTGVQASQERASVEASWKRPFLPFAGVEASWKRPFLPFAGVEASLINPDTGNSPLSGVDAE